MSFLLPLALATSLLAAEESDEARAKNLVRTAQKAYRDGKYRDAIAQFQEALALKPRPALHYNLARCFEALGEVAPAMKEYREYLRLATDATDRAVVQESVVALEGKLASKGLRQLQIVAEPATSTVSVDGRALGPTPLYVELEPGSHTLRFTADGFEPIERKTNIEGTRSPQVSVTLRAVTDAPVAAKPEEQRALVPTEPPPPTPPLVVSTTEPGPRPRIFTWVAGGTAVVAAGVATGFGVASANASNDLRAEYHVRRDADALVAQTRDNATAANVMWAVAGTALVTGVVLFFVEGR